MKHLSIALLALGAVGLTACRTPEDESSYEVEEGRAVTLAISGMT